MESMGEGLILYESDSEGIHGVSHSFNISEDVMCDQAKWLTMERTKSYFSSSCLIGSKVFLRHLFFRLSCLRLILANFCSPYHSDFLSSSKV